MLMNFSKLSVLVVEDLVPMQQLLDDTIRALGVGTIYTSPNGKHGYKQYISKQPDIIITDWHMPEMDGLQFIEKVRKDPDSPCRNIPIIMISGLNASARITKARDTGVNEYLVKPFNAEDLAKRISHIVNQPRDFIITQDFTGPNRRRAENDDYEEDKPRRTKEPEIVIKADKYLQQKIGTGQISPNLITKSETVMDETEIDFAPIAQSFLKEFKKAIDTAEKSKTPCEEIKEDITLSIMQLKANASTFKHDLIGELSGTTLEFLESTAEIDKTIIEILNAQHSTLSHLVNIDTKSDGGIAGEALKTELEEAYKRYNKAKATKPKDELLVDVNKAKVDA